MSELTYNVILKFEKQEDHNFWLNLLIEQRDMFNYASEMVFKEKPKLILPTIANLIYYPIRKKAKLLNAQAVCKIEREVLATFRSIKSNKHRIESAPIKKNLCMRLDKRLYSKFSKTGISLISGKSGIRCRASLALYKKIENLFNQYPTSDPLIFYRDNNFYLSIPFKVTDKVKENEDTLGIDLGCRRLVTTSDGQAIKATDYLRYKRKIRYLKRKLASRKKSSHSARRKLKELKRRERNYSKQYIEKTVNSILNSTKQSIIAIEDLTKIKENTKRDYGTHNNRISQIPFYMFKHILTYKATLSGKEVKTVSPKYTSQIDCSTNKRDGVRKGCRYYSINNYVLDADWNAAINIKNRAENIKHLVSYAILPLDGTLSILNKQVAVNQPIVSRDNIKLASCHLLRCQ